MDEKTSRHFAEIIELAQSVFENVTYEIDATPNRSILRINCPFAENSGEIANFQTAIYGVDVVDTPIFRGALFRCVKSLGENAESCDDFWHGLTKFAEQVAFGAEIRESRFNFSERSVLTRITANIRFWSQSCSAMEFVNTDITSCAAIGSKRDLIMRLIHAPYV